jgi:hypothetical protein
VTFSKGPVALFRDPLNKLPCTYRVSIPIPIPSLFDGLAVPPQLDRSQGTGDLLLQVGDVRFQAGRAAGAHEQVLEHNVMRPTVDLASDDAEPGASESVIAFDVVQPRSVRPSGDGELLSVLF